MPLLFLYFPGNNLDGAAESSNIIIMKNHGECGRALRFSMPFIPQQGRNGARGKRGKLAH